MLLEPEPTVTEPGTVSAPWLLESDTVKLLLAALVRATVHVELCPVPSDVGEHETEDNCAGATKLSDVVFVTLFALAVMVAVWSEATVEAVAVKVVLVEPLGTVTLPGTVRLPLLSDTETVKPPVEAADVKDTVQVELPGVLMLPGEQPTELNAGTTGWLTVMVPPVPVVGMEFAEALEAAVPPMPTGMLVAELPEAMVKVAVAMLPLGITGGLPPK